MPKLRERAREEHGFSLIELMVVMLIIGLLAAIGIAAYLNQRGKGEDVEAKSGVQTAANALEVCGQENDGRYDRPSEPCDKARLLQIEPSLGDYGPRLEEPVLNPSTFEVTIHSKRASDVTFTVARQPDGTFDRRCTVGAYDKGGCPRPGGAGPDW
jgi:prepilin-type N-terminal cleavage/methylation domain-containing protein